jgi:DNA-binding response OmpR family regulator
MNAAPSNGTRLLVVDDDRLVLATLCAGLRQAGFDVIEADNGDDAILLARQHKPRLALLDMRMQGKSGLEVARYLAANTRTGFLFLSAFSDPQIMEEARQAGALGYLVKPVDMHQIVPAVRDALARQEDEEPAGAAVPRAQRDLHIAAGILMERLRIDHARAVEALRARAREEGATLEAFAASMVEAANRLNSIPH